MHFNSLVQGTLVKRYKRFLADVELNSGELVVAHCPNTGAMTGCAEPGWRVWLSPSNNPKRKLAYTWELAQTDNSDWIGINTQNANKLVSEALTKGVITELLGYQTVQAEVKFGEENSRVDFLLTGKDKPNCYLEVKSVTLALDEKGFFPDAKTERGRKHLRELASIAQQGQRAVLLFCVQHTGIQSVSIAKHIDEKYAQEWERAKEAGVEVFCYSTNINNQQAILTHSLPFI